MSKGSLGLYIPTIGSVTTIWDEVFSKLIMSFTGLLSRKKVLYEYSRLIETHTDVVLEVLRSIEVSSLSSVLMRISYHFGDLILCFKVHMPPIL